MSESLSLRDRYLALIDQIVQMTLKGQIRSKEQVYQLLLDQVSIGTGEIFEYGLDERSAAVQHDLDSQTDELKQAKATRMMRALKTIRAEWERWQEKNQAVAALTMAVQQITEPKDGVGVAAAEENRLQVLLSMLDPNRNPALTLPQWQQLATLLRQRSQQLTFHPEADRTVADALTQLADGIGQGLDGWAHVEPYLVSWMYDQSQGQLGFGGGPGQRGPWALWAAHAQQPASHGLFEALSMERSLSDWAANDRALDHGAVVELAILLRCIQQGLVTWFDKLVYDSKVGAKLSVSTFLSFALIWSQLANGLGQRAAGTTGLSAELRDACVQITLQILRTFSQRDYFPLYGGIFVSFSGAYLKDTLSYLDEPLRRAEGTQEKARILVLLGYSQRAQGQVDRAIAFYQQALQIAREAGDRPCEVASLNHLSRAYVAQLNYGEAINYSQRALILSRQVGDRMGEANALANLGYGEVFQAQQLESDPEVYETAVGYLQQGLQLSERQGDRQSQALCLSSLGIAEVVLGQATEAIAHLEAGIHASQFSGDLYLQGLNLAYLAEAHYRLNDHGRAIATGGMSMYLLSQIGSSQWRQPAGLLTILQGQLGEAPFQTLLSQQRPQIIAVIGVDGYDHLPTLLDHYRHEG